MRKLYPALCFAFATLLTLQAAPAFSQTLEASVFEALRAKRPELQWRLDSNENLIYVGRNVLSLGNVKKEIASRGLEGDKAISFAVATIAPNVDLLLATEKGAPSWNEVKEHVLPTVAPIDYMNKAFCRQFSQFIATCAVIDSPTARSYVMKNQLEKWGISGDELEQTAMANLVKIAKLGKLSFAAAEGKVEYAFAKMGDSYDATRILLPNAQAMLSKVFGGTAFAAIPNRDFLISWPSGSALHTQLVDQIGSDFKTRSHPLSDEIFVIDQRGVRLATEAERRTGTIQNSR